MICPDNEVVGRGEAERNRRSYNIYVRGTLGVELKILYRMLSFDTNYSVGYTQNSQKPQQKPSKGSSLRGFLFLCEFIDCGTVVRLGVSSSATVISITWNSQKVKTISYISYICTYARAHHSELLYTIFNSNHSKSTQSRVLSLPVERPRAEVRNYLKDSMRSRVELRGKRASFCRSRPYSSFTSQ